MERREAHDAERREREAQQAAAARALRRRLLLADSLVPRAGRHLVLRARWDDDNDAWTLPPLSVHFTVLLTHLFRMTKAHPKNDFL